MNRLISLAALLAVAGLGCGDGDDKDACVPGDACSGGKVCAEVLNGEPACLAPVRVEGTVVDAADDEALVGAAVVVLDANAGALSDRAITGTAGAWSAEVPAVRDEDGRPVSFKVTLRADAQGYEPFPRPPRSAIPVDLADAVEDDGAWVVDNAATDLALVSLETAGIASIEGTVNGDGADGILVVAESGGVALSTAISDRDGDFTLFNVPVGAATVSGFKAGVHAGPVAVDVPEDGLTGVELDAVAATGVVTGSVNRVDAGGGMATSVILVLESTFLEDSARGELPGGLRAGDILGEWRIEGVPPGRYVVLAAFENDGLVRDPDEGIAGTDLVRIDVADGATVAAGQFKITGALNVLAPGADGVEDIADAEPVLAWQDDSSEDGYEVRVYDGRGNLVHEALDVPRVTGSTRVEHPWTGATLEPGMIYQFRAWSFRIPSGETRSYISSTEDLKGVFRYAPATP